MSIPHKATLKPIEGFFWKHLSIEIRNIFQATFLYVSQGRTGLKKPFGQIVKKPFLSGSHFLLHTKKTASWNCPENTIMVGWVIIRKLCTLGAGKALLGWKFFHTEMCAVVSKGKNLLLVSSPLQRLPKKHG